jgi:hypothetical protein
VKKIPLVFVLFLCIHSLFARDVTIIVKDIDLELPLEGAVIRLWDGTQLICDEDGKAVIQAPDRQVVIQAVYPGYETGRMIIPAEGDSFTISLRLSGVMQSRELVIEAARPGSSETRTGRSIAVGEKEIAQTAEIGIIEDVMTTIKLLPGVNYTGFFDSQPSIRGGHPGDMSASLDGYYVNNPYHWGGGFSIFDPRMVQSAQLSHGVFSTRYGHTISGLLEVTSKKPSPTETQFQLGVNTSAANFNLSIPFQNKGGILFMGRVTYYDPVIDMAKELSKSMPELDIINFVLVPPYIRAGTVSANYRFTDSLEASTTGFWGMDGVGVYYLNTNDSPVLQSDTSAEFDFTNYQGFITTAINWNPRTDMLLKFSIGTGFEETIIDGGMTYNIYDKEFTQPIHGDDKYQFFDDTYIKDSEFLYNAQGRVDFDWELNNNILLSAGIQEMFNYYKYLGKQKVLYDMNFSSLNQKDQEIIISEFDPLPPYTRIGMPVIYSPDAENNLFTTSAYALAEYGTDNSRFKAEIGLRLDHFYLTGKGFTASSAPALNPRLNLDFNILKNTGFLGSLDISAGSGLFSSINNAVFVAEEKYKVQHIKPNRSWTSVLGINMEFPESLNLNIEGYYKYIFDRMYIPVKLNTGDPEVIPQFDGEGVVWGIDLMLQKIQGRFWDGWLAYSYNWAKYRDPEAGAGGMGISGGNRGDDWYFPHYHRFHNLNLIFNYRPIQFINIYLRFGIISGVPLSKRIGDKPINYPVLIYDKNKPENSYFIEKFYWHSVQDDTNRTTASLPMDIKFSIFGNNRNGKTRYEVYFAIENVLALLYSAQGNTSFNQYTGQVDTGSTAAAYEIPIPIPSFGFKISY